MDKNNEKKDMRSVDINLIIALCHIVDQFEEFRQNLDYFISDINRPNQRQRLISQLGEFSHGKRFFNSKEAQQFYLENQDVIDTINKYIDIKVFINTYLDVTYFNQINYLYEYILKNRIQMLTILLNLVKIKRLGFKYLLFNENLDFSNEIHYFSFMDDNELMELVYLENMEALPSHSNSVVKYKSNASCYKIRFITDVLNTRLNSEIMMNDLTIDRKRLPDDLSKEAVWNNFMSLSSQGRNISSDIRSSTDLRVGITDLSAQLAKIYQIVDQISDPTTKDELAKSLLDIRGTILKMQNISQEYDNALISNNESVTTTLLNEEKKLLIKRRSRSSR